MKRKLLLIFVAMLSAAIVFAQNRKTITGTVKDASGLPLIGVSITEVGSTNGVSTDGDGKFSINVGTNATLKFTFVGYKSQEISVTGKVNISVTLEDDAQSLNEVVVTSLGIKREAKSLGYAVTTIGSKDITEAGATNFASAIYGKAPGVRIASATGGATSGVNINIRGVNSINNKTQPLIVLDGIPIRDGDYDNNNYWGDQRMRGNGLLDINPEDIETLTILKGASAAALYGSDAVNGVILITTKSGKGKSGFTVDFNANASMDKVGYLPRYQNVRGPGVHKFISDGGQDDDGFVYQNIDGVRTRGVGNFTINFGPKFDGKPTLSWDGQIRPYEAQKDNYARFFQTGHNSNVNVAVSHSSENSNTRFSLTRQDNAGVSYGNKNERNIANLNSSFNLGKSFKTDLMVNYINQYNHNRPFEVDRMINNFTGMIGRFDNPDWYAARYKTSLGYRYVTGTNQSLTPSENILYPGFKADVADYMWNSRANQENEYSDRLIASLTNTWTIIQGLDLRARIGTDYTNLKTESSNPNDKPLIFGNSGYYGIGTNLDKILYGDALLSYTKQITSDFTFTARGGYTVTKQNTQRTSTGTNDGLNVENWFDLAASRLPVGIDPNNYKRNRLLKEAYIGTLNLDYKGYLFVEGTLRSDRVSIMYPGKNEFLYPSVNSAFVFSEAFDMPAFFTYGKLRASWGIVGNYPKIYEANVAYNPGNLGNQGGSSPISYTTIPANFGNDGIKSEEKKELEFGLETKFLNGRLGLDVSYYDARINNQILSLTLPATSGATSILANVGSLRNKGVEVSLTGTPVRIEDFRWTSTLNYAFNKNTLESLNSGASELLHADYDGNAAQLRSTVGQPIGDIYVHPIATNAAGEKIVSSDGLYKLDDKMVKVGNYMPKAVGGFINNFTYKGLSLDVTMDYRFGGHVMPTGINWMISRGLLEESLNYMDAAHGGLGYYLDANGNGVATTGSQGPNGQKVYDDGMLMQGVDQDGKPNTNVISQAYYYWNTYNWGGPQYESASRYELYVKKNSYIKMREIALGYQLPKSIASKIGAKNLQLSVFGRNLFFLYRTLKDLDPEQLTSGSRWTQTITNSGGNPATRTFGIMLRSNF